jgi:hypothetical protein
VDAKTRRQLTEWKAPVAISINVATANASQVSSIVLMHSIKAWHYQWVPWKICGPVILFSTSLHERIVVCEEQILVMLGCKM